MRSRKTRTTVVGVSYWLFIVCGVAGLASVDPKYTYLQCLGICAAAGVGAVLLVVAFVAAAAWVDRGQS